MLIFAYNLWDDDKCPYDSTDDICKAANSSFRIMPEKRSGICRTENYDNCAIFLSKCLQMSKAV
jgi:hypothetical protein